MYSIKVKVHNCHTWFLWAFVIVPYNFIDWSMCTLICFAHGLKSYFFEKKRWEVIVIIKRIPGMDSWILVAIIGPITVKWSELDVIVLKHRAEAPILNCNRHWFHAMWFTLNSNEWPIRSFIGHYYSIYCPESWLSMPWQIQLSTS